MSILQAVGDFVWGPPMMAALLGTGLYSSIRLGFFQLRHPGLWLRRTIGSGSARAFAVPCAAAGKLWHQKVRQGKEHSRREHEDGKDHTMDGTIGSHGIF